MSLDIIIGDLLIGMIAPCEERGVGRDVSLQVVHAARRVVAGMELH
jgi:hypothetical protein